MNLKNKKVAILGLGLEGKDVVNYLNDKEVAELAICDIKQKEELDISDISLNKVIFYCGTNYLDWLDEFDVVFRSPGIYRLDKRLLEVEKKGVVISSAIKLFFDECPARIIGVTGTKGKGTTSTLIYEILKNSGKDVYLAGNIGKPYLSLLPSLNKNSFVVLELSSFQLFDLHKSPNIAVVLNITTDHLDWHKDRDEYVNAKKNIVKYQGKSDFAILNADYEDSAVFQNFTSAQKIFFSTQKAVSGAYVLNGNLFTSDEAILGRVRNLQLRGRHNWENVAAAVSVANCLNIKNSNIKSTVFSFTGLEHRLELVSEFEKVSFYNDSFSTNPQTVAAAVNSFSEPLTLILGGFDKGLDYDDLAKKLAKRKNLKVIVIGDIAKKIQKALKKTNFSGQILNIGKEKMQVIVEKAKEITPEGGVVLLSPGSSSFDMFASYKDRGNQFKNAVQNLRDVHK